VEADRAGEVTLVLRQFIDSRPALAVGLRDTRSGAFANTRPCQRRVKRFYSGGMATWRVVAIIALYSRRLRNGDPGEYAVASLHPPGDGGVPDEPSSFGPWTASGDTARPAGSVLRSALAAFHNPGARQLAAWYGHGDIYEGIKFSFFKSASSARSHLRSLAWLYGGKVIRNAVVAWDQKPVPSVSLRQTLLGCLRAASPAGTTPATRRGTPAASLATFAGRWGGHTRGLTITSPGRVHEYADDGCCDREYEMTFQLLSVSGTITRATATYRVTSFKRYHRYIPSVPVGRIGTLLLRNGIVTNKLTPAAAPRRACRRGGSICYGHMMTP
jgi:hypothetical protein